MFFSRFFVIVVVAIGLAPLSAKSDTQKIDRAIHKEITLPAPVDKVWKAWTTEQGIKCFFATACKIDMKVGGAYEIYFDTEAKPGQQGSEGAKILAIQPHKLLSFTWNAPPHLPEARKQYTHVTIRLAPEGENATLVVLHHDGWGEGDEWDKAFTYFDAVWGQVVLQRLVYYIKVGPVDWENPPPM